jgi:putative DNA primase/helicase
LDRATQSYTGTLLDAFLSKLVPDQENHQIANQLKRQVSAIARTLAAGTSDSAVARVANRFALVQVALEVAHSYGLLPFPVEHISWAISKVFHDWLNYRGGDGSIEVKNACDRILNLFVTQKYSDRIYSNNSPS